MAIVPFHNVARYGVIKDVPDHSMPPEAWSDALNMRFVDDKAIRIEGTQEVMGTPSAAPSFLMSLESSAGIFWIYAESDGSGSHVYAFNSNTHAEISKAGGYNVTDYKRWNGTVFHGTPIINPVSDDPQFWSDLNLSTNLQDLSNWPANTTCRLIRTYKNYLVALYIVESGNTYEHRVKWSHFADPGTLPSSWDDTDPAVDAGEYELSDVSSGVITEALPLRDLLAIYKNESTWLMRFKGGTDVMEFANILQTSGILGPRAIVPITLPIAKTQVHFLHNGIDIGVFNGQDFQSVVDERDRKYVLGDVDSINYENSFCFEDAANDEVYFAYPEEGETNPSKAMVWNYRQNTITFRDFTGAYALPGAVESSSAETWATAAGTWAGQSAAKWQQGARRKVVSADIANTKLLQLGTGEDFNGTSFSSYLERTGLAIVGVDREGNPKVDYATRKLVTRIWPKITGGRVRVTVGGAEQIGGTVSYTRADGLNTAIFDPSGTSQYVDVIHDTRLVAVKFEGVDGDSWELHGYDMDLKVLGRH